ncbi:MAG: phytanoyl-CoA dioxygenase family protein [Pseudomonadota bacterium]|nr:phytanoyl-CoA dioxygenase family protein [Pseudomonadota bacterium]
MSSPLSPRQMEAFHRDGFVLVPGLYSAAAVDEIAAWTDALAGAPEWPGGAWMYFEPSLTDPGRRLLCRIENFCPHHPGFHGLLTGALQDRVGELLGEPAVLFKDKINFKLPGGDGFKAHQDVQAGWDAYARLHVTALISIDAATPDNGCLELAPGWHRRGRVGDAWRPLEGKDLDGMAFVACPTRPGDVVFFDSFAPHRSGPNLTGRPRRVLYVTYNRRSEGDQRARYYADKHRSYPPDCERQPGREYVFRV